jgi:hypothetical protein
MPRTAGWFALPPGATSYILANVFVPDVCLGPPMEAADGGGDGTANTTAPPRLQRLASAAGDVDRLVHVDITVDAGRIVAIDRAVARPPVPPPANGGSGSSGGSAAAPPVIVDLRGGIALPAFADLHTHIDKAFTCERSRNPTGSLTGADRSTAADAVSWFLFSFEMERSSESSVFHPR